MDHNSDSDLHSLKIHCETAFPFVRENSIAQKGRIDRSVKFWRTFDGASEVQRDKINSRGGMFLHFLNSVPHVASCGYLRILYVLVDISPGTFERASNRFVVNFFRNLYDRPEISKLAHTLLDLENFPR